MGQGCAGFRATLCCSRRALLTAGFGGIAGLNLPGLLRAESRSRAARAKHVIFLHQFGGPSHIDTFDMKPNAPSGIRGEFKPIPTSVPELVITEHLPRWARVMHHCALVRSVNHRMKNHNSAGYYSLTGHAPPIDDIRLRDTQELHPAYGSVVARLMPVDDPAVPTFVSFPHVLRDGSVTPGQHASFLGKSCDPFFVGGDPALKTFRLPELSLPDSVTAERLQHRRELLSIVDRQSRLLERSTIARGIDEFYERALSLLVSESVRRAFDMSRESPRVRESYGNTTYGQSCLLARRLVEAGVRFVTVYFSNSIGGAGSGGWDTHQDNFNDLKKRLLPITDRTVPTLIEDLAGRGLLEETLIVWMGEFGRGPKIGDRDGKGRNHWPQCYTVVFAGGPIHGGSVVGSSDKYGAYPAERPTSPDDLAATMFDALGIDPAAEVYDTLDRPLPIARGRSIHELFS
jgi:hypothetical protein